METNFEELSHDTELISRMKQFREASCKIENVIETISDSGIYERLSNSDKIRYNLLLSYSLNSLFWMYLRTEGMDPTKHEIKMENDRLKKSMLRAKQISDRTLMPRVDQKATQRFVRHSLWEPKEKLRKQQQ